MKYIYNNVFSNKELTASYRLERCMQTEKKLEQAVPVFCKFQLGLCLHTCKQFGMINIRMSGSFFLSMTQTFVSKASNYHFELSFYCFLLLMFSKATATENQII